MKRIEIISGSLSQAGKDVVALKGDELHIAVFPNTQFEEFTKRLSSLSSRAAFIYRVRQLIRKLVLAMVPALLIALGLSIMSMLDQTLQVFLFNRPDHIGNRELLLIAVSALALLILAFLPTLLSEGKNNPVRNGLRKWFTQNSRRQSQMDALIRTVVKRFKIKRIVVFNIDAFSDSQWPVMVLIPTLDTLDLEGTLHVRNHAIERMSNKFSASTVLASRIPDYADTWHSYWPLMSKEEQNMLILLAECSTIKLDQKCSHNVIDAFVSIELVEYLAAGISTAVLPEKPSEQLFENFIHAAEYDYGMIDFDDNYCRLHTAMLRDLPSSNKFNEQIFSKILKHRTHILDTNSSSLVSLLIYWHLSKNNRSESDRIAILEQFIKRTFNSEQNRLFMRYWDMLAGPIPYGKSVVDSFKDTNLSLYHMLSPDALDMLISLKERSGDFDSSEKLVKLLIPIQPLKYRVKLAFTLERKGDFAAAYAALPTLAEFEQSECDQKLYFLFLLRKAWIIVSARMEKRKSEGLDALNRIVPTGITNADSMDIWIYYNTLANYAEWEGRYDDAIVHYEQCLGIAGVGYSHYGGTLVNMGIAYRLAAVQQQSPLQQLQQAVELGAMGCQYKRIIDDLDELPIALHNQALNLLELWYCDHRDEHLRTIETLSKEGLSIMEHNNAVKRYGMLSIEHAISLILQKKDEDIHLALERLERWPGLTDATHHDEVKNMALLIDKFVPESQQALFEGVIPER